MADLPSYMIGGSADGGANATVWSSSNLQDWNGQAISGGLVSGIAASDQTVIAATVNPTPDQASIILNRGIPDGTGGIGWELVYDPSEGGGFQGCNSFQGPPVATNGDGIWLVGLGVNGGSNIASSFPNLLRSTDDGATWDASIIIGESFEEGHSNPNIATRCLWYGNGLWLAAGQNGEFSPPVTSPVMYYSLNNGATWSPCETPFNDLTITTPDEVTLNATSNINCITYNGSGRWLAGNSTLYQDLEGYVPPAAVMTLITSTDGLHWSAVSNPFDGPAVEDGSEWPAISGVAYGKGTWLAIGFGAIESGPDPIAACTSADGINWEVAATSLQASSNGFPPEGAFFNFGASDVGGLQGFVYYTGHPQTLSLPNGRGAPVFIVPSTYQSKRAGSGWSTGSDFGDDAFLKVMCQSRIASGGGVPIRQYPRDDALAPGGTRVAGLGHGNPSSTQGSLRQGFRATYT